MIKPKIKKTILVCFFIASLIFTEGLCSAYETLYLTWSDDPTSTMDICWIGEPSLESESILYHLKDSSKELISHPHTISLNKDFSLYTANLKDLFPNREYSFSIGSEQKHEYQFQTLSDDPKEILRFVVGGDVYRNHQRFLTVAEAASKHSPHFALIGGDIAHANDSDRLFSRWLDFFKAWNTTMSNDDKLVPILATLGNHDLKKRFDRTVDDAKYFYKLFPSLKESGGSVLDIGSQTSIFILDTQHAHEIKAQQQQLESWLAERQNRSHKIALYHVSAYPNVRKYNYEYSKKIRKYWTPLFEKYNLSVAFENHEHAYKRTVPILDGTAHPDGVVYMGGGGWGMRPRTSRHCSKHWYLEKSIKCQHCLLVTVENKTLNIIAIDSHNNIIDEYKI